MVSSTPIIIGDIRFRFGIQKLELLNDSKGPIDHRGELR